jgi:TetR/AcrR family transcriptional regulator
MDLPDRPTRERVLEAARVEFSGRGFDGARVDHIAQLAGVNKAMIYYHFRSKADLYQAVIEEFLLDLAGFLERAVEEQDDLAGLLSALAGYYLTFFESAERFAPIVLRELARGGERLGDVFAQVISAAGVLERVRQLFGTEARAGKIRDVDVAHSFVSFIGMNLVYVFFSPILNTVWEIEDEEAFRRSRPEQVVDLFLNGIRAR